MRRVLLLLTVAAVPGPVAAQTFSAAEAPIVTSDIDNFWAAWDRLPSAATYQDTLRVFFETYYLQGSPGLYDFVRARIGSVIQLVDVVRARPKYYASIRESTLSIEQYEPRIRDSFVRWAALYPPARFPGVYVVIGRMSSGGTTSDERILIGAEMYGRTPDMPEEELNDWHRQVLSPVDRVPAIVAHELIHTQQRIAEPETLLGMAIAEGSADFLGEMISGGNINAHVHEWANPREAELWTDFRQVMDGGDRAGWLYTSRRAGEPADLGYWMGYKITEAYFQRAEDKQQAIIDILTIQDFGAFLEASGYGEQFE